MKRTKRVTAKVISAVMAVMMLFSLAVTGFTASAAQIEVAQTGITMTGGEKLYLKPNSNWTMNDARFAAYLFGSGDAWASLTAVDGEDGLYELTVPAGSWTNVIFCRMNPSNSANNWNNKWNQTPDLTYDGTKNCYTIDNGSWDKGTWGVYTPPVPEVPEEPEIPVEPDTPAQTYTVYYVDSAYMGNVYAYAWTGDDFDAEWPGSEMTLTDMVAPDGSPVYSYTFTASYENLIFNDGNNLQTGDLEFVTDKYLYWNDEVWYENLEDIPESGVTQPYMSIYFCNNWKWDDVCIYYAGSESESTSWPGIPMEYYGNTGTDDVLFAVVPSDVELIVINGLKNDASGNRDQTPDIVSGMYSGICYTMTWNDGNAVVENHILDIIPETPVEPEQTTATLVGSHVSLEGQLVINMYMYLSQDLVDDETTKINIGFAGSDDTTELSVGELDYDGDVDCFIATYAVAAKELATVINIQVTSDTFESEVYDYTVQDYLVYIIEEADSYTEEVVNVAKALLNYGAAAQVYFGYNTENLANDVQCLTEEDKAVATADLSQYAPVVDGEAGEIEYYGASLTLKSETSLNFYFFVDAALVEQYGTIGVNVNGMTAALTKNGDLYEIRFDNIMAHQLGEVYTINTGCETIEYSALSYAYLAQQSSNSALVNVANALAAYYNAVTAYIG